MEFIWGRIKPFFGYSWVRRVARKVGHVARKTISFVRKAVPVAKKVHQAYKCGKMIWTVGKGIASLLGDGNVEKHTLEEIRRIKEEVSFLVMLFAKSMKIRQKVQKYV